MKKISVKRLWLPVLLTVFSGMAASCDAVVAPDDHAAGVVFLQADGVEAARFILQGRLISGGLTVPANSTTTYRVRVITESGGLADIGGEYSIDRLLVLIPSRVGVSLQGEDQIVLSGLVAGGTTLRFYLKHGGHDEFEIQDIPITIQ